MIHLLQSILSETTRCGITAGADARVFRVGVGDDICPRCRAAALPVIHVDIGCKLNWEQISNYTEPFEQIAPSIH